MPAAVPDFQKIWASQVMTMARTAHEHFRREEDNGHDDDDDDDDDDEDDDDDMTR